MTPIHHTMILNKLATAPYCTYVQVNLSLLSDDELITEFLRVEDLVFQGIPDQLDESTASIFVN